MVAGFARIQPVRLDYSRGIVVGQASCLSSPYTGCKPVLQLSWIIRVSGNRSEFWRIQLPLCRGTIEVIGGARFSTFLPDVMIDGSKDLIEIQTIGLRRRMFGLSRIHFRAKKVWSLKRSRRVRLDRVGSDGREPSISLPTSSEIAPQTEASIP